MSTTIVIEEGTEDRTFLQNNHYNVQVSKGVSAPNGEVKFNVVYHSRKLAPSMTIAWVPTYGLNWTSEVPNKGAKVTYTGKWQPCDIGQSYDLTETGGWQINNDDPNRHPDCLNVGRNGYSESVNIVVGILNEDTGAWQAFFVNPDKLPPNGFAQYQPRDNIQIWFAEGIVTETMISTQSTKVENFNMSKIPLQYFWYEPSTGNWKNQDHTFNLPK